MKTQTLIGSAAGLTLALAVSATTLKPERPLHTAVQTPKPPPQPALRSERPEPERSRHDKRTERPERVVRLDEVRIVATRSHRSAFAGRPQRTAPRATPVPQPEAKLVPCSDWRALGPVYSAPAGTVPRERHVQLMCPEGSARH
jgi:hypothetical protein